MSDLSTPVSSEQESDERENPENSDTHGKPTGLKIFSEFDKISLTWNKIGLKGLTGINIYRKVSGESGYSVIHQTPADSNQFIDDHVDYDLVYKYLITAVSPGFESQ